MKFFINEGYEFAFYLLALDGSTRLNKLKIKKSFYSSNSVAKYRRNQIAEKLELLDDPEIRALALKELDRLYINATQHANP